MFYRKTLALFRRGCTWSRNERDLASFFVHVSPQRCISDVDCMRPLARNHDSFEYTLSIAGIRLNYLNGVRRNLRVSVSQPRPRMRGWGGMLANPALFCNRLWMRTNLLNGIGRGFLYVTAYAMRVHTVWH